MSWKTVPASELMVKRGGSINPSKHPEEVFDLLSIAAFDIGEVEVLQGSEIGSSKSCVEPNDVLLSKIVPHIRRCWVVPARGPNRQIGSGEWIIFRDDRFNPGFLKHFLTSDRFHAQFLNTVAGVGGSLVRARPAFVEKIDVPLPTMEEQKRIAAILDKADNLRRKRQQAIQLADEFLRAVFLDMFGDPLINPKGWKVSELRDQIVHANNGLARRRKKAENVGDIVLRLQDVQYSGIEYNKDLNRIELDIKEKKRYRVDIGDILLTRVNGNPDYVGRSAVFKGYSEDIYHNDHLIRIKIGDAYYPEFIAWCFNHSAGRKIISGQVKTSAGQHTISQKGIESLAFFRPPLKLQEKFVSIMTKAQSLPFDMIDLDGLFGSLSQKAFSGEL